MSIYNSSFKNTAKKLICKTIGTHTIVAIRGIRQFLLDTHGTAFIFNCRILMLICKELASQISFKNKKISFAFFAQEQGKRKRKKIEKKKM